MNPCLSGSPQAMMVTRTGLNSCCQQLENWAKYGKKLSDIGQYVNKDFDS